MAYDDRGLRYASAVTTAQRAGRARCAEAAFADDGAWIDFRGPPGTIPTVSFSDLVERRVDPAVVRGRIVVVGASAPTLQDVHFAPTAANEVMSRPEVQANAIWTALHGLPLRERPPWRRPLGDRAPGLRPALATLLLRPLIVALLADAAASPTRSRRSRPRRGPVVAVALPGCWRWAASARARWWSVSWSRLDAVTAGGSRCTTSCSSSACASGHESCRRRSSSFVKRLGQAAELRDDDTGEHIAGA